MFKVMVVSVWTLCARQTNRKVEILTSHCETYRKPMVSRTLKVKEKSVGLLRNCFSFRNPPSRRAWGYSESERIGAGLPKRQKVEVLVFRVAREEFRVLVFTV